MEFLFIYQEIAHALHEFLSSFRAKYCYLFVYLFSANLSYASTSLEIHKSSLGQVGLAEEGVPFSRSAALHLAKLLLPWVSLFLFPTPLLCSPPHQYGASCSCLPNSSKQVLLCCWKIFSFHFLTCVQKESNPPSGCALGAGVPLRGARKAFL